MTQELKIIGINPIWISALLTGGFLLVCATGGENIRWGYLGYEVIFPFYASVSIGEWCKIRNDPMFDVIFAQGTPLFRWVLRRFLLLFCLVSIFATIGIFGVAVLKVNVSILDLLLAYLPTAFLLSSISAFVSLLTGLQHIATMTSGIIWLFSIMTISLLRFRPMQFFYLFVRFAGIDNPFWLVNKLVLLLIGMILWLCIFFVCKKRLVFS